MSLIAHYRMDGDAKDSLGLLKGTANNITWTTGKLGQCGSFNGTNSTVNIGIGSDLFTPIRPEFSISTWFKSYGTTATTGTSPAICGLTYGVSLRVDATSIILWLDNGSSFTYLRSPYSYDFYNDDKWHHVVATATPTQRKLYIDGVLVGTQNDSWLGRTRWPTNTLNIGRDNNNSMYFFRGLIDDFRIYDHALSPREVRDLAQAKVLHYKFDKEDDVTDCSGQDNHGTNNGATWVEDSKIGSGCYEFDGVNDEIITSSNNAPFNFGTSDFSISLWASPNVIGIYNTLLEFGRHTDGILFRPTSSSIQVYLSTSNGGASYTVSHTRQVGRWDHYVVTRENGLVKTYVNNVMLGSMTANGDMNYNGPAKIGSSTHTGAQRWNGEIDDVRVYATALSADEIQEIYQQRASLDSEGSFHVQELKTFLPVWKNFGGPLATSFGANISDRNLHEGTVSTTVIPYQQSGQFGSHIDKALFQEMASKRGAIWRKEIKTFDNNGNEVPGAGGYEFDFPLVIQFEFDPNVCMLDAFQAFYNTSVQTTHRMPGKVHVLVNGTSIGSTDLAMNGWSGTITTNLGLANVSDQLGEPSSNYLSNGIGRHIFSYGATSTGQNAIRCQPRCWNGSENVVSEVVWSCLA